MHDTQSARHSATAGTLFGPPALSSPRRSPMPPAAPPRPLAPPHRPRVSAVATGTFKLGRARLAAVDVHVDGIVFSVLVRGRVVVPPFMRGETAIRFSDPDLDWEVQLVAVEAAQDAKRRGWLK